MVARIVLMRLDVHNLLFCARAFTCLRGQGLVQGLSVVTVYTCTRNMHTAADQEGHKKRTGECKCGRSGRAQQTL